MYLCFEATVIPKFSLEIEAREITSEKPMLCPQVRLQLQSKVSNERAHLSHSQSSESGPSGHCIPVGQAWTGMNCSGKEMLFEKPQCLPLTNKWRLNLQTDLPPGLYMNCYGGSFACISLKVKSHFQCNGCQHQRHLLYLHSTQDIMHRPKTKSEESSKRHWHQLPWGVYKAVAIATAVNQICSSGLSGVPASFWASR